MPLTRAQIIPELLLACPELQPAWDAHAADWAQEDPTDYEGEIPGDYNNASAIIHAVIDFHERAETAFFPRFFRFIERLISEGDPETRNIAVVGYLETLQTAASWKEHGPEVFVQWMQPESQRWWQQIHQFWRGGEESDRYCQRGGSADGRRDMTRPNAQDRIQRSLNAIGGWATPGNVG